MILKEGMYQGMFCMPLPPPKKWILYVNFFKISVRYTKLNEKHNVDSECMIFL